MIITRHISLDKDCVKKMKPVVERHNGNFSAAIREIIDQAGKYASVKNSLAIDRPLLKWMLEETEGLLVPDSVVDEVIEPGLMNSMEELEECLNQRFSGLEWDVNISLKYDSNSYPSNLFIEIRGNVLKARFVAGLLSQFLVKNSLEHSPLGIKSLTSFEGCVKLELSSSSKKEALDSLTNFFGSMDAIVKTVRKRPVFWRSLIKKHVLSNYNMITVHRNHFEDLLAGRVAMGEITIENLAKKPIQEIPLEEMLSLIKEVYETSRVADKVEIGNNSIIVYHTYRNADAVENLKKGLVALLKASGHAYDAKSTANMIVFSRRSDLCLKVDEAVEDLDTNNSNFNNELVVFMAFLKGLEGMSSAPSSIASPARSIGKSIMREYEKENNIDNWSLADFQNVFGIIDSKFNRNTQWSGNGGRSLTYKVRACTIAAKRGVVNPMVCHAMRETFKGALSHAFKGMAELEIKKLLTHGDDCCEVGIKMI